jgi:hypothetical protein
MELEISRVPLSDDENELGVQPYTDLNRFFNSMSGVRDDFGSEENLRSAVNCCILNGLDGHLIGTAVNVPLLMTDDYDPGKWDRIVMGLAHLGHLTNHRSVRKNGDGLDSLQFELSHEFLERHPNLKANILNRSRILDRHKSSDHKEVNSFIDAIYEEHFGGGNAGIKKKHIKTVLLDLYVAWTNDPTLKIAVHKSSNAYKAIPRYNELHITKTTIPVVNTLRDAGLIREAIGFHDPGTKIGRTTRIWPTTTLIKMFEEARFGPFDITYHPERECIILRNDNKEEIEYDDTDETNRMREILTRYNSLLNQTFIDIPTLENSFVETSDAFGNKTHQLYINQLGKFTRRIFNRGSFDYGGRFYGGWWQLCPKAVRHSIFMNNHPVSEIDYSGLHMVILYANEGIDYWTDIGIDPYQIRQPDYITNTDSFRSLCKLLILVALNARNDKATFAAFRDQAPNRSSEKQMKDDQLSEILEALKERHRPIARRIANDAGIELMAQDSAIAARIIDHFTQQHIPVLCVHDSFLVPFGWEGELVQTMENAFEAVTGIRNVRLHHETHDPLASLPLDIGYNQSLSSGVIFSELNKRINPERTQRYQNFLKQFEGWLERTGMEPINHERWEQRISQRIDQFRRSFFED